MATTLESLLSDILNTVYGKDMRQSIHDAIEQCYADATGNPDSVAKLANDLASYSQKLEETRTLIQQVNDSLLNKETILYSGDGSTVTNSALTLGDSVKNYDYLDIHVNYFGMADVRRVAVAKSSSEFTRILRYTNLTDDPSGNDGVSGYQMLELCLTFSDKRLKVVTSVTNSWTGAQGENGSGSKNLQADSNRTIAKVVGIKNYKGTSSGNMNPQSKTVSPTFLSQSVLPDDGYNCLSQVTVNAIPVSKTDNNNGTTVTIG